MTTSTIARAARRPLTLALLLAAGAGTAGAAELAGSMTSMTRQHQVAVKQDYEFLRTEAELEALVAQGALERVESTADLVVDGQVTHEYARPEVRLFLERLATQYREVTGKRLVVTSLVRPRAEQPGNAHRLSVHPAGMAVDLRVPANAGDRAWLEQALLGMERRGLLDVTRERRPPHYHVAVYPAAYRAYAEERMAAERAEAKAARAAALAARAAAEAATPVVPVVAAQTAAVAPEPSGDGAGIAAFAVVALGLLGATVARTRTLRTTSVD